MKISPRFKAAAPASAQAEEPAPPLNVPLTTTDASDLLAATVDAQLPMIRVLVPPPPLASAPTTASAPAAPKADPDAPLREQLRVSEGSCFASLSAGPGLGPPSYFARVEVTVVPTGAVSRAEIASTDVTDRGVLDCLRATAAAARFSDNDGGPLRTYSIDVRVVAH
jgi:hypothetical protein